MPMRSRANECRVKLLDPDAVTDNVMAGLWLSVTGKPGLASSLDSCVCQLLNKRIYDDDLDSMVQAYGYCLAAVFKLF